MSLLFRTEECCHLHTFLIVLALCWFREASLLSTFKCLLCPHADVTFLLKVETAVACNDEKAIEKVKGELEEEGLTPDEAARLIQSVFRKVRYLEEK